MRFGYFKNIFTNKYDKFRLLDKIKSGKIDIKNIKYLTLKGYSNSEGLYPNEEYLYICSLTNPEHTYICFDCGYHENYIKNVPIEVKKIGYWKYGSLSSIKLTVKNNKILIESEIKPN